MPVMLLRFVAAALSGVLLYLTAPPLNLAGLAWFLWVPLLVVQVPGRHKLNLGLAYAAGWIAQTVIYSWLVDTVVIFSSLPMPIAVLVLLLFSTAFSVHFALMFGGAAWLRQRLGLLWVLALPVLVIAVERLFPQLFPYYQGVTQYRHPWIFQSVSVFGVWGLSFLVMLSNCVIAETVIGFGRSSVLRFSPSAVPWSCSWPTSGSAHGVTEASSPGCRRHPWSTWLYSSSPSRWKNASRGRRWRG